MKFISNININSILCAFTFQQPVKYVPKRHIRNHIFDIYNFKENQSNYTMEHIIPQSFYKNDTLICRDLHNIFPFPSKVNSHRSNYEYIASPVIYPESKILDENGKIISFEEKNENSFHVKNSAKRVFYPKDCYKGEISRAAMYFCCTYPEYTEKIFQNVICPYTIIYWHYEYKPSDFEKYKSKQIEKLQGNYNIFVECPEMLLEKMEILLKKKFKSNQYGEYKE